MGRLRLNRLLDWSPEFTADRAGSTDREEAVETVADPGWSRRGG